jgi:hypothetical protein
MKDVQDFLAHEPELFHLLKDQRRRVLEVLLCLLAYLIGNLIDEPTFATAVDYYRTSIDPNITSQPLLEVFITKISSVYSEPFQAYNEVSCLILDV